MYKHKSAKLQFNLRCLDFGFGQKQYRFFLNTNMKHLVSLITLHGLASGFFRAKLLYITLMEKDKIP